MVLDIVKLEKLKIKAYKDKERKEQVLEPFEVLFNPESFSQKYEIQYSKKSEKGGMGASGQEVKYTRSKPSSLKLNLVLDGTDVSEMGMLQLGPQKTVSERIKEFLKLTYKMDGKIHEPHYLKVEWGDLDFSGRLGNVNITYTSFNRDGKPLRAELDVTLVSDIPTEKRLAQDDLRSADLTHTRTVKSGDTLPLLCKEIYGSSALYLRVAQANKLDGFRNLTPGREIVFPPLKK